MIHIIARRVHAFLFQVCDIEKKLESGMETYIVDRECSIPINAYSIKDFLFLKFNNFIIS